VTMDSARSVGVLEIGGSHLTAAIVDPVPPTIGPVFRAALDPTSPAVQIVSSMAAAARRVLNETLAVSSLISWGIAIPGPFDYASGIGKFTGVGKFENLHGVALGRALARQMDPPPRSLTFVNDAEAFLLGEWWAGAASGFERCVGLTLGTGVGSAFLRDGTVIDCGPSVPPAGHAYRLHIYGRPLEDVVSTRAIIRQYQWARPDAVPPDGVRAVAELARSGDPVARAVINEAFTALGRAFAPWLDRFEAQVLVVGGSMTTAWDLIGPALHDGLNPAPGGAVQVRKSRNSESAALLGAARATILRDHDSA
jgi:glucokinase